MSTDNYPNPTNVAIYARNSKDSERSIEEQTDDCRAECERKGWTVVEEIADNDLSASRYARHGGRPGFEKLEMLLGTIDIVVVWEQSRLSRKESELIDFIYDAEKAGTAVHVVGALDVIDADDLEWKVKALFDAQWSAITSKRTRRALLANAKAGIPHGIPPFGYVKDTIENGDGKTVTTWAVVEPEAELVRSMVAGLLEGLSTYEVARRYGNGKSARSIRLMLLSPSYAAIRNHKGTEYAGNWPALISEDEHRRLVALLTDPSRKSTTGNKARHLLSGIARCGICGTPVGYITQDTDRSKSPQYRCPKGHVHRRAELVDAAVVESLMTHYAPEIARRRAQADAQDTEAATAAKQARELRQRLDAELAALVDADVTPTTRAKMMERMEAKYQPQIAALESKAGAVVGNPLLGKLDAWESFTIEQQRSVVRDTLEVTIEKMQLGKGVDPRVPVSESVKVRPLLEFRTDDMQSRPLPKLS